MWVPVSQHPHWSTNGGKRKSDSEDEGLPPHMLKKPKTQQLDAETLTINGVEIGHCAIQVSFIHTLHWNQYLSEFYIEYDTISLACSTRRIRTNFPRIISQSNIPAT